MPKSVAFEQAFLSCYSGLCGRDLESIAGRNGFGPIAGRFQDGVRESVQGPDMCLISGRCCAGSVCGLFAQFRVVAAWPEGVGRASRSLDGKVLC